jgi:phospholipid/cholesterol/gamma-HCH transport system permease protein
VIEPLHLSEATEAHVPSGFFGRVTFTLGMFGRLVALHLIVLSLLVRGHFERVLSIAQMATVGVASLPIVAVTLVLSGMVIGYHVAVQAGQLGVSPLAGWLVSETMCRELSPVMAAFVVAARSGSAMTAELGTMKATEQIDALRAMAVDPIQYLVVPRYIAGVVMLPLLAFLGDVLGTFGGYIMALLTPQMNAHVYFSGIPGHLAAWDVCAGIIKAVFFGMIIALVCSFEGLTCAPDSEEVGRATTRAVVYCIMLIYAADVVLTTILYHG